MLLVAKGIGRFETLGATLDDSIGEAFDKVARFLGLGFNENGGCPAIEKLAIDGDEDSIKFPIPLAKHKNCNFSLKINFWVPLGPVTEREPLSTFTVESFGSKIGFFPSFDI